MSIHYQTVTLAVIGVCPRCRERSLVWTEDTGPSLSMNDWHDVECASCEWSKRISDRDVGMAYREEYRWRKEEWIDTHYEK